jgi:long-chain acyl-CoA synthetase
LKQVIGLSLSPTDERSYERLLDKGRKQPAEVAQLAPDDLCCLIYTSGTTGEPKGVCLSHLNICSNVNGALDRFDFIEGDVSLAFLPWAHIFGQTCELYSLLAAGAAMALNDEIPRLVENLAVVRPTVLVAVPRVFNRIYDGVNKQMAHKPGVVRKLFGRSLQIATKKKSQRRLGRRERLLLTLGDKILFAKVRQKFGGRLRFVVSGSAALSPVVAEFIDALGIDVFEGYGLTQTSPVVSANYPGHRKIGTVGPPFPEVQVIIDTSVTGDPENGEIVVRGPGVMKGYFNRPEETTRVLSQDGSFRTGDMGALDSDGFLKITGRIKEQYKLENGKYVVPSPLEEQLKLSPYVANVMIYGANKAHNVALVVLDEGAIREWMSERGLSGDPLQSVEVKRFILSEVSEYSAEFKGYERVRDVALISEDFTTENGMLTPKMSLKRHNVLQKYSAALEGLYPR